MQGFRKYLCLLWALLLAGPAWTVAQDYGGAGPHEVRSAEATVFRPDGTWFTAHLFFPEDDPGPFPGISFAHGFLGPPLIYRETITHIASWGYVVVAPASALELFPDHEDYAEDISLCLTFLENENVRQGSPLFDRVDIAAFGLSGHSMGGGASMLAAAFDPRVGAIAAMAPAETWPSAIEAASAVDAPVCLIAGSADQFTPLAQHAQPLFEASPSPKLLAIIKNGNHCGFTDLALPDVVCDPYLIPQDRQLALARRTMVAFFELYLKGAQAAWTYVWGPGLQLDRRFTVHSDPGLLLSPPAQRKQAPPGAPVEFSLTLANTGTHPDNYILEASGNTSQLAITPSTTPVVDAGASMTIKVRIAVPANLRGATAFTILSARSVRDGASRDFAVLGLRRAAR